MNLLGFSVDWTVFMSLKLEEKYIYCSKFGGKGELSFLSYSHFSL